MLIMMMMILMESLVYPNDNGIAWNFATKGAGGKNHHDDDISLDVDDDDYIDDYILPK